MEIFDGIEGKLKVLSFKIDLIVWKYARLTCKLQCSASLK